MLKKKYRVFTIFKAKKPKTQSSKQRAKFSSQID